MNEKDVKTSFVLYLEFEEQFNLLTNEQAGILIKAIFEYVKTGNMPHIEDKIVLMAFSFIKSQLDRDIEKWKAEIIKRRAAGKKGMQNRWNSKVKEDNQQNNNVIKNDNKNSSVMKIINRNNKYN